MARECAICGDSLKGKRGDAIYCDNPACRKAGQRQRDATNKATEDLISSYNALCEALEDPRLREVALSTLETLEDSLTQTLNVQIPSRTKFIPNCTPELVEPDQIEVGHYYYAVGKYSLMPIVVIETNENDPYGEWIQVRKLSEVDVWRNAPTYMLPASTTFIRLEKAE